MDGLGHAAPMVRLRAMVAWMERSVVHPSGRGVTFWLVTALLGLLLPAPIAVAVIAARLRGGREGGAAPATGRTCAMRSPSAVSS